MNTSAARSSTLKEWSNFMTVLNEKKYSDKPLLHKAQAPSRIMVDLEKQFSRIERPAIFRRLGKHRQLSLQFA
jgi:hypothetical protein